MHRLVAASHCDRRSFLRHRAVQRAYGSEQYCILVNTTGREDGFEAIDMLVEHAVKDIKVSRI